MSYEELILAAILKKSDPRRDLLGQAVAQLTQEHFVDEKNRNIFRLLVRYYDRTGDVMPQDLFTQSLTDANVDTAKILVYTQTYKALAEGDSDSSKFTWAIGEIKSAQAKHFTGIALTEAMEILERGYEDSRGKFYKGHEEARNYLSGKLNEIDRLGTIDAAPEGNVFNDYDEVLKDYAFRKANVNSQGILTGISAIDDRVDGWQPGELIMVCAYAGQGKSMLATQAAWDCAVMQKKSVFFATSETLRAQVIRRILARHSRLPMFDHPINSADIKKGTLSPADEKVFHDVLEDWHYNSEYGKLNVVQVPSHTKLTYVESRLKEYMKTVEVALAIDDYLPLHAPLTPRGNEREEFNESIRYAKGIATDTEIPFVTPWQVKREAYEASVRNGYYTATSLADTSEADKCQPMNAAILTPHGWSMMSEMRVGTKIVDPVSGGSTEVVRVHEAGLQDLYRVTFDDGAVVETSPSHVWNVRTTCNGNNPLHWRNVTTKFMDEHATWNFATPVSAPVVFDAPSRQNSIIHPYVLGILLGDGCLVGRSSVKFSVAHGQEQILDHVSALLPQSLEVRLNQVKRGCSDYSIVTKIGRNARNIFVAELRRLQLKDKRSWEKFVPNEYLKTDVASRTALLRGLMDADGHANQCSTGFVSTSLALKEAVVFLAESLQCKVTQETVYYPTYKATDGSKKQGRPAYRCTILAPNEFELFALDVKNNARKPREESVPVRYICNIERIEVSVPMRCIEVATKEQLYVTNGFVVTHNSADQIIALLREEENNTDMRLQFLKMRDDAMPPVTSVSIDFSSSYIGAHLGPVSLSAGNTNNVDLMSLAR